MEDFKTIITKIRNVKDIEPTLNFLDVIGRVDNENIISNWLSFIFDYKKMKSSKPLELFLRYIKCDFEDLQAEIYREYSLTNKRRIDIIIKLAKNWVVIENKINSFECNEQTKDYTQQIVKEIDDKDIDIMFIYLKPNYNKSSPSDSAFKVMTYKELYDLLRYVQKKDFFDKTRFRYFSEFLKLIKEKYIVEQELNFSEKTKIFTEYREELLGVEKSYQLDCINVKNKLCCAMKEIFPEEEGWVIKILSKYIQFFKKEWPEWMHFEIGTWDWQKQQKNISFESLIAKDVEIEYCLHAEGKAGILYGDSVKELEKDKTHFGVRHYNFSDESKCMESIHAIAQHLKEIKEIFAQKVDYLIKN
ncbi:MAG: PD-(D/E)XK nuclease family protein [Clostridia bacterium]|nr:PD-(D/E)XK nuclease family protein [Clostridia bacterium]